MRVCIIPAIVLGCTLASASFACSPIKPLPSPDELVRLSEVILRARVLGISDQPGDSGVTAEDSTQVDFVVVEILKGAFPSRVITFNGHTVERDDPNDRPIPYDFVRPGGRTGTATRSAIGKAESTCSC